MHSSQARPDHRLLHMLRPAIGPDAAPMSQTDTPIARRYGQAAQARDTASALAIEPAHSPSRAAPTLSRTTAGARGLAHSAAIIARTAMPLLQPIAGMPDPSGANVTAPERVRHTFSNGFGAPLLQRMAWPAGVVADRSRVNRIEATIWPGTPVIRTGAPLLQRAPWTTQAADQPPAIGGTMADTALREAAGTSRGMPLI
jgi:hypothetical protein